MPDSPDLTPPPEQPMPDEARAHIRRRLAAATAGGDTGHGGRGIAVRLGRWTTPVVAAAAVVAVVLGAFAVRATQDDSGGPGRGSLQPADVSTGANGTTEPTGAPSTPTTESDTSPTPTTGTRSPSASQGRGSTTPPTPPVPTATPGGTPVETLTPSLLPPKALPPTKVQPGGPGFPELPEKAVSCDEEVKKFARFQPSMRDATVTAKRDHDAGTTYLYETKKAWLVCDSATAVPGGPQSEKGYVPTLISFHTEGIPYQPSVETLSISENWLGTLDNNGSAYFFAAGRDFDGVQAISYTFPDGHTEDAVVGQNGLWSMSYLPTEGVLADPKTNSFRLDEIQVTVHYTGGERRDFAVRWGYNTCAQINHGC